MIFPAPESSADDPLAAEIAAGVRRITDTAISWSASRWSEPAVRPDAGPALRSRGQVLRHLVEQLADAGADAESRPRRPLPDLADGSLIFALQVVARDLLDAHPPAELARAVLSEIVLHRADLDPTVSMVLRTPLRDLLALGDPPREDDGTGGSVPQDADVLRLRCRAVSSGVEHRVAE